MIIVMSRQVLSHLKKRWFHHMWHLLWNINPITTNVTSFFLLPPVLYADHDFIRYETSLGSFRVSYPSVSSQFPMHTSLLASMACKYKKQKRPWHGAGAAQQEQKYIYTSVMLFWAQIQNIAYYYVISGIWMLKWILNIAYLLTACRLLSCAQR